MKPRDVECPRCGAGIGIPCRALDVAGRDHGAFPGRHHEQRIEAMRAALYELGVALGKRYETAKEHHMNPLNDDPKNMEDEELDAKQRELHEAFSRVRDEIEARKTIGISYDLRQAVGVPEEGEVAVGFQVQHPKLGRFYVSGLVQRKDGRERSAEILVCSDKSRLVELYKKVRELSEDHERCFEAGAVIGPVHISVPYARGRRLVIGLPPSFDDQVKLALAVARGFMAPPQKADAVLAELGALLIPRKVDPSAAVGVPA
jgi:hypothetical protein